MRIDGVHVDSLHVVIQEEGLNEQRPQPPHEWFAPRGLRMAAGTRPSSDSLKVFITFAGVSEPLYLRTTRAGSTYLGLVGFHSEPAGSRSVELIGIGCPAVGY